MDYGELMAASNFLDDNGFKEAAEFIRPGNELLLPSRVGCLFFSLRKKVGFGDLWLSVGDGGIIYIEFSFKARGERCASKMSLSPMDVIHCGCLDSYAATLASRIKSVARRLVSTKGNSFDG